MISPTNGSRLQDLESFRYRKDKRVRELFSLETLER